MTKPSKKEKETVILIRVAKVSFDALFPGLDALLPAEAPKDRGYGFALTADGHWNPVVTNGVRGPMCGVYWRDNDAWVPMDPSVVNVVEGAPVPLSSGGEVHLWDARHGSSG